MVFDMSGIHAVNFDYCECPRDEALDRRTQLLRQGWFPCDVLVAQYRDHI